MTFFMNLFVCLYYIPKILLSKHSIVINTTQAVKLSINQHLNPKVSSIKKRKKYLTSSHIYCTINL